MKRSNRSFEALQIGHASGGCSRAQRYPHTLHRQTGNGRERDGRERDGSDPVCTDRTVFLFPRLDRGGLRSGTGAASFAPFAMDSFTYRAQ